MADFQGSTIWARQTLDSDIFYWKPDKWFKIWFFIVNRVNYQDNKLFDRGENFITYPEISLATKATKHQIDQFMRWAKKEQMLTTRKTTRGMVIKVLRYAEYQDSIKTKNDTVDETQTKHKRNINDTINKQDKHDKNYKQVIVQQPMAAEKYDAASIQRLMDVFYKINPTLQFGNKTQRKAIVEMYDLWGEDKTTKMAEYAVSLHGEAFAPTITTPYLLKLKASELAAHWKKGKSQSKNFTSNDPNL